MSNYKYELMTDAQKRVAVAKDVIIQIEQGTYTADSIYFFRDSPDQCTVCGIGACMVSLARIDDYKLEGLPQFLGQSEQWAMVKELFGNQQLALIEEYFEYYDYVNNRVFGWRYKYAARQSEVDIAKISKPLFEGIAKKRLIQIMENIIRNGGTFDPEEEIQFRSSSVSDLTINKLIERAHAFKSEEQHPGTAQIQQHST